MDNFFVNYALLGRVEQIMQANNLNELLDKAKNLLKEETTEISYQTWFKNLQIASMEENNIVLIVDSIFQKDLLESKFQELIINTFNFLTNMDCNLSFILKSEKGTEEKKEIPIAQEITLGYANSSLNQNYTFDTFVVGNNNSFAHAASLAVAEAPGSSYNPLFLYGGVGLGKTHLMHAIGNEILRTNRNTRVLYVTSERFTNEFIDAIKSNKMENFRNKYRNIDVLLIDDIQFIAGKERIQEEFFHTFNTLYESKKQIILSSDRPPRDITLLEDRLKSRFEWGLIVDISLPDYETRFAILRKKAENEHIIIDDSILSNIALKIDTNVRELEGVLNKMVAIASLTHSPITVELAERSINDVILQKEKVISADFVQEIVARYFNIDKRDLKGSKRSNDIAFPRQIAMYLCRDTANMSFPQIGNEFGKRDHTTVMHAYSKIEKEIKDKPNTKLIVKSVKKILLEDQNSI